MFKPIPLFVVSMVFTALTVLFLFSPVSLNGFKADVYFVIITVAVNILSIITGYKERSKRVFITVNITLAVILTIGLAIFINGKGLHVTRVYSPHMIKQNLYASLTLRYEKGYFRKQLNSCGDGTYWETYVPTFFPLIEIETKHNACFVVNPPGGSNLYTFAAE